jgi:hypothetical protein
VRAFGSQDTSTNVTKARHVASALYNDSFSIISRYGKDTVFTPDYGPSSCAVPGKIEFSGWYAGGPQGGPIFKGSGDINDEGSCYFKFSYAYWQVSVNGDRIGRLGMLHGSGSWGCDSQCGRYESYFVFPGGR